MEQPTQAEALRTAAQAAYELLSSGLFNIPDEKYCVVTALAESLRGSQQAERAVPAALPGGVWYVPCTAGAGTTEGAYQEGWNACIKAMLAAPVQQAAPAGDALDAARLDFMIAERAYVVSDETACDGYWLHWARPDGTTWVQGDEHATPRAAIDSAIASQQP